MGSDIIERRCHYAEGEGRMLPTHVRDCNDAGCEGCEPCNRDHCTMPRCSRHLADHEPYVCARCVGDVRTDLRRIVELCTLVPIAATEQSINAGPAAMAGPIADHAGYSARHQWVIGGGACRCAQRGQDCPDRRPHLAGPTCGGGLRCGHETCERIHGKLTCPDVLDWLDNADDERHPLWVLGSWDLLVAEHLGHNRTMRVTVETAAHYLASNLTDLARYEDFAFDELAREVHSCVEHVEDVLAISPYTTKGAPCPTCRDAGRPAKRLERTYGPGKTDHHDEWTCPTKACGKTYELGEYDEFVYREWLSNAPKLTAEQIRAQYRIPEGTLRRWANGWHDHYDVWREPTVRKHGYDGDRKQLYDVADVKAMRDLEPAVA